MNLLKCRYCSSQFQSELLRASHEIDHKRSKVWPTLLSTTPDQPADDAEFERVIDIAKETGVIQKWAVQRLIGEWRHFKALSAYASHDEDCSTWNGQGLKCTCGLDKVEQ